jgi:hypothetical protein
MRQASLSCYTNLENGVGELPCMLIGPVVKSVSSLQELVQQLNGAPRYTWSAKLYLYRRF